MPPTRRVAWRQLCAIASHQLEASGPFPVLRSVDPVLVDWFEWAERIKDRLVRLRLNYPEPPQVLTKAMEAAYHAWVKRAGLPRSAAAPRAARRRSERPNVDPPWPRSSGPTTATWTLVGRVMKDLALPTTSEPTSTPSTR